VRRLARPIGGWWGRWLVGLVLGLIGCGVLTGTACGAVVHDYLEGPSEEISASVPGGVGEPRALGVSDGSLWEAELSRVNGFDAASGGFVSSMSGGLSSFGDGVAVGHMGGKELVYANSSGGMAVFDGGTGELLGTWSGSHVKRGVIRGVAVDDTAGETEGFVYISSGETVPSLNVVNVFDPAEALGPGEEPAGTVAVLSGTCENENAGEEVTGLTPCAGSPSQAVVPFSGPGAVAVSGFNGDVFVTDGDINGGGGTSVDVFEPVAGHVGSYRFLFKIRGPGGGAFSLVTGVAVDPVTGEVYVADRQQDVVDQFTAKGEYQGQITGISEAEPFVEETGKGVESVAAGDVGGEERVFVGDYDFAVVAGVVDVFGRSVVVPDVEAGGGAGEPTEVTPRGVVLHGTVNPLSGETGEGASCEFLYGTTRALGQHVACSAEVAEGNAPAAVEAVVENLAADTTYFYRLQAGNKSGVNPGRESEDKEFKTTGPGVLGFASEAASTAVTLNAKITPDGGVTSYYFQYSTKSTGECVATAVASSCASVPAPPGEGIGSGVGQEPVEPEVHQRLQGLSPGTVYHYRVVAVSEVEEGGALKTEVFPGPDETFVTQSPASGSGLIDGRDWELVSQPDKHGSQLLGINEGWVIQSSASGEAFTYVGSTPTEATAKGYDGFAEQIFSTRTPEGWASKNISLPHASDTGASPGQGQDYRFFSEDLSLGVAEPIGEGSFVSLAPEVFPPDTERTPYIRHNNTCSSTPETCFEPLLTSAAGYSDLPEEGTKFGGEQSSSAAPVRFDGASPDGRHVVVQSEIALSKAGAAKALYEFTEDAPLSQRLQPVSVLPGGGVVEGFLGENAQESVSLSARGAVSGDGSRVLWTGGGGSFLRDVSRGETLRVPGSFQIADREASRVFFTNNTGLEVCEVVEGAGGLACGVSDLTPGSVRHPADVLGGVLGVSEDGSYVYYVANGVLGDGAARGAKPGDCPESTREQH
jgi:hypothetical protein